LSKVSITGIFSSSLFAAEAIACWDAGLGGVLLSKIGITGIFGSSLLAS